MIFHIAASNFTLSLSPLFIPDNFVSSAPGFLHRSAIPSTPRFLSARLSIVAPLVHSPRCRNAVQVPPSAAPPPPKCRRPAVLRGELTINSAIMRDCGATGNKEMGKACTEHNADVTACCRAGRRSLVEALHRSRYYTQLSLVPHPQTPRVVCTAALLL